MRTKGKSGEPCWRQVAFKLVIGEFEQTKCYRAKPSYAYTLKDIEQMIETFVDQLDKNYPQLEFRMVRVGPNRYNFIAEEVRTLRTGAGPQNLEWNDKTGAWVIQDGSNPSDFIAEGVRDGQGGGND